MLTKLLITLMLFSGLAAESYHSDLASRCETCRGIVNRFKQGLVKTAKSNFGGGNTHWEEKHLGSYAFSETRLLEIMENVCGSDGARECHHMVESKEDVIENWWFKHYAKGTDTDLNNYLCVSRMRVCCPNGTFGMDCRDCDGGRANPCKGNGQCSGDGTRSGTGSCTCDMGYTGNLCDACTEGFYEDSNDESRVVCKQCHGSCKLSCSEGGPGGCDDCRDGWILTDDRGCVDENECEDETACDDSEFCLNTEGSYKCLTCNKACRTCVGSLASDCTECARKYYRHESNVCKPCHVSCATSCTDDNSESCDACTVGWVLNANGIGCQDVDECSAVNGSSPCDSDEYCINTIGSYKCATCHSACLGCTAAGIDRCIQCKPGFSVNSENHCIDIDECSAAEPVCNKPQQKCVNVPGSFKCVCETGFVDNGDGCQVQINKPSSNPKSTPGASRSSEPKVQKTGSTNAKAPEFHGSKKKTKKSAKQLEKDKLVQQMKYGYFGAICGFVVVGNLLKNHLIGQCLTTATFSGYLLWFGNLIDSFIVR